MSSVMTQEQPTRETIENPADTIRDAHHEAMKKTIPVARLCQHSIPYWDEELSMLHDKRMQAKETC